MTVSSLRLRKPQPEAILSLQEFHLYPFLFEMWIISVLWELRMGWDERTVAVVMYCCGGPQGLFGSMSPAVEGLCNTRLGQEFLMFPMQFCSESRFRAFFFSFVGLKNWGDLGICFYTWDTQLWFFSSGFQNGTGKLGTVELAINVQGLIWLIEELLLLSGGQTFWVEYFLIFPTEYNG